MAKILSRLPVPFGGYRGRMRDEEELTEEARRSREETEKLREEARGDEETSESEDDET